MKQKIGRILLNFRLQFSQFCRIGLDWILMLIYGIVIGVKKNTVCSSLV